MFGQIFKSLDHYTTRNTKADKDFTKIIDFENTKYPLNTGGINQIEEKNYWH